MSTTSTTQILTETFYPADHGNEVAALEAAGERVSVTERSRLDAAGLVAQLERQVGAAGSGLQTVLADAGENAANLVTGT